jgi:phage anti-repressor protein
MDNKSNCNIYLWCKEKKTELILNYIYENTDGFIKDKVFIYNTKNKIINKYGIKKLIINIDEKNKIDNEFSFDIKDINVANYLDISLITLRKRLNNAYSKTKRFIENVDYIRIKTNISNNIIYMLNYPCFKRLAMSGDSKQSEVVRMYFTKLRESIPNNKNVIYQTIQNIF